MLALLIALLAPAPAQQTANAPDLARKPAAPAALVGVLTEEADFACEGTKPVWGAPHFEVGFVRLLAAPAEAAGLVGKPVLVEGTAADGPAVGVVQPCEPMQMRDDWSYGKNGIRIVRHGPPVSAFRATAARPFEALRATRKGDDLLITVKNPLDRPMKAVRLTLYYEGCYGKPGSTAAEKTIDLLAPGAEASVTLAALDGDGDPQRRPYAARSIDMDATVEGVAFDLNIDISDLGTEAVVCPRD